jgi:hypothetical protein
MERIVRFGDSNNLVGIETDSECTSNNNPFIVLLNAGMIPKFGPNRMNVRIARTVKEIVYNSLRFDFSNIGESGYSNSEISFETNAIKEVRDAMDYIEAEYGKDMFILCGICTGGDIALKTALEDRRVIGVVSINGMLYDWDLYEQYINLHSIRYFFNSNILRAFRRQGYHKKSDNLEMRELLKKKMLAPVNKLICRGGICMLLIYSDGSYRYHIVHKTIIHDLSRLDHSKVLEMRLLSGIDSNITPIWSQDRVLEYIRNWIIRSYGYN